MRVMLVGVFVGWCVASTAQAKPALKLHLVAQARGPAVTDGVRWAAWEARPGVTHVVSARSGRSFDRVDPTGCSTTTSARGLVAAGSGELLYDCEPTGAPGFRHLHLVVEDIASGATHNAVGADRLVASASAGDLPLFSEVGRQWIEGSFSGYHSTDIVALNWHTGEAHYGTQESKALARTYHDLDAPHLLRRLCRPLRRPRATGGDILTVPTFADYSFQRPFGVTWFDVIGGPLLQRCGHTGKRRLGVARLYSGSVQLRGRWLTWADPRGVISALLIGARQTTGRVLRYSTGSQHAAGSTTLAYSAVGHTNRAIYASTPTDSNPVSYRVYVHSLPQRGLVPSH
jgi:hypothetical protein